MTIRYLSGHDVTALDLDNDEIFNAIETSLRLQGEGQTVIGPRMHLVPDESSAGHFNVLRGYIATGNIVGDYHDNYKQGLPSEFGLLNLFDGKTGHRLPYA